MNREQRKEFSEVALNHHEHEKLQEVYKGLESKDSEEVAKALQELEVLRRQEGLSSQQQQELRKIASLVDSFWLAKKIERLASPVLDDLSTNMKRKMLMYDWQSLVRYGLVSQEQFSSPESMTDLDEHETQELFARYRAEVPGSAEYFAWQERSMAFNRFTTIRHNRFSENINKSAFLSVGDERENAHSMLVREKRLGEHEFSRIAPDVGVVYGQSGDVEGAFRIDDEILAIEKKEAELFGEMPLAHIDWLISRIRKAYTGKEPDALLSYFQCHAQLPSRIVEKVDIHLPIEKLPEALFQMYDRRDDFEQAVEPHKETTLKELSSVKEGFCQELLGQLEVLRTFMETTLREKQCGCAIHRDTLSVLYRTATRLKDPVPAHHGIARIFYHLDRFPNDVVAELKERFPSVADALKDAPIMQVESFNDYVELPEHEILAFLDQIKDVKAELRQWLEKKLRQLICDIDEQKETPNIVQLDQLLEEELRDWDIDSSQQEVLEQNYQEMMGLLMRTSVEKTFDLHLDELPLSQQLFFLHYIHNGERERVEQVVAFVQKYGLDGVRAFTALEQDESFGEVLIALGHEMEVGQMQQLLERYARIIEAAQDVSMQMERIMSYDAERSWPAKDIRKDLLARGRRMLQDFARNIHSSSDSKVFFQRLQRYREDILLFASLYKTFVSKEGEVPLDLIRGMELASMDAKDISQEDREEMLLLAQDNWKDQKPEAAEHVLAPLRELVDGGREHDRVYILKQNDEVQAFVRFEPVDKDTYYVGSFNVRYGARGASIGETMLKQAVDREAQDHKLVATVYPELAVGTMYVEDFGCVITGVERTMDDGRIDVQLTLRRDDKKNEQYKARSPEFSFTERDVEGVDVKRFDVRTQYDEMIDAIQHAQREGFVISRYQYEPGQPAVRWLAFEKDVSLEETKEAA